MGAGRTIWDSSLADWQWGLGVNLWGVIHGLREFVPVMLAQNEEGHIVNTSSVAGLTAFHPSAIYQTTKHAVVALSENLYYTLALSGPHVKASVLCPGWVQSNIMDAERNRPEALRNPAEAEVDPIAEAIKQRFAEAIATGMPAAEVADQVFRAIREERFYIITHADFDQTIGDRLSCILERKNPPLDPVMGLFQL